MTPWMPIAISPRVLKPVPHDVLLLSFHASNFCCSREQATASRKATPPGHCITSSGNPVNGYEGIDAWRQETPDPLTGAWEELLDPLVEPCEELLDPSVEPCEELLDPKLFPPCWSKKPLEDEGVAVA